MTCNARVMIFRRIAKMLGIPVQYADEVVRAEVVL